MNHSNNWKYFERIVAAIHKTEANGAEVKWDDKINGRQFDVTIRFSYAIHSYLTVIECKNYSGKVPVEKVDALVTKARDAKANKAIMISSNGYQSGCYDVAERHGIALLTLNERSPLDEELLSSDLTPALNLYDVKLKIRNCNSDWELEDIGGKLHYLINNIIINENGSRKNIDEIITEWQVSKPEIYYCQEHTISISFKPYTTAEIPLESDVEVDSLEFQCQIIDAVPVLPPYFDGYLKEALETRYELISKSDGVTHQVKKEDVQIGFDTNLEVGNFYENPNLHISYYCESINEKMVTFIVVETYQHGVLHQARIKQDIKYSYNFLEITDKKRINTLGKLLERYKNNKR